MKTRTTRRALSILPGAALGVSLGVLSTNGDIAQAAADAKINSGLECVQWVSSNVSLAYSREGFVYNGASNERLTLLCPVTRDMLSYDATPSSLTDPFGDTLSQYELDDESTWVRVEDRNPSEGIDCWFEHIYPGGTVVFRRHSSTGDNFVGGTTLTFSASGDPDFDDFGVATTHLRCDVPSLGLNAPSGIRNYRWEEQHQ